MDFSIKTAKVAWEAARSESGATKENESLEAHTESLRDMVRALRGVEKDSESKVRFVLFCLIMIGLRSATGQTKHEFGLPCCAPIGLDGTRNASMINPSERKMSLPVLMLRLYFGNS